MPTFREPSGRPAWPLILVEGPPKSGSSVCAYSLSRSPRVGWTGVIDLRDDVAHEYRALGPYELAEPDGGRWTLAEIEAAVRIATTRPRVDPNKPNAVVLDKGTYLWEMLGDRARMRAENSNAGKKALREDPDAEVNIGHALWNDAGARWTRIIRMLQDFPGIGVIVCEGEEITKFEGGKPTKDRIWKVKADKSLPAVVDAWVRMSSPGHRCHVIGVRSLTWESTDMVEAGAATDWRGYLELANKDWRTDNPLDHLVFDVIAAGREFEARRAPQTVVADVLTKKAGKARFLDGVRRIMPALSERDALAEAGRLWDELVDQHVSVDGEVDADRIDAAVAQIAAAPPAEPAAQVEAPADAEAEVEGSGEAVADEAPPADGDDLAATADVERLRALVNGLDKQERRRFLAYAHEHDLPSRSDEYRTAAQVAAALAHFHIGVGAPAEAA